MDLDRFGVATFNLYNLQLPGEAMNPRQQPWSPDGVLAQGAAGPVTDCASCRPTSSGSRSSGTPTRCARSSSAPTSTTTTTCWPSRPRAGASSAPPWCAEGCCAAIRSGSTSSPPAMQLRIGDGGPAGSGHRGRHRRLLPPGAGLRRRAAGGAPVDTGLRRPPEVEAPHRDPPGAVVRLRRARGSPHRARGPRCPRSGARRRSLRCGSCSPR